MVALVLKACLQREAGCGLSPDPLLFNGVVSPLTQFPSAKKRDRVALLPLNTSRSAPAG